MVLENHHLVTSEVITKDHQWILKALDKIVGSMILRWSKNIIQYISYSLKREKTYLYNEEFM